MNFRYVSEPGPWKSGRWRSQITEYGMPHDARRAFFGELVRHLARDDTTPQALEEAGVEDLISCIVSIIDGRPIASRQKNLRELLNSYLMVPRRHRLAQLIGAVCKRTNRKDLLAVPSLALKVREATTTKQDGRASVAGRVVLAIFPDLFKRGERQIRLGLRGTA